MSEPARRFIEVVSTDDAEIDAISLCLKAIREVATDDAMRARVAEYIASRFSN